MTLKELRNGVIKEFLSFVEEQYPTCIIDTAEGQTFEIMLDGDNPDNNDWISFHKSRMTLDILNEASQSTKDAVYILEDTLEGLVEIWGYEPK